MYGILKLIWWDLKWMIVYVHVPFMNACTCTCSSMHAVRTNSIQCMTKRRQHKHNGVNCQNVISNWELITSISLCKKSQAKNDWTSHYLLKLDPQWKTHKIMMRKIIVLSRRYFQVQLHQICGSKRPSYMQVMEHRRDEIECRIGRDAKWSLVGITRHMTWCSSARTFSVSRSAAHIVYIFEQRHSQRRSKRSPSKTYINLFNGLSSAEAIRNNSNS